MQPQAAKLRAHARYLRQEFVQQVIWIFQALLVGDGFRQLDRKPEADRHACDPARIGIAWSGR